MNNLNEQAKLINDMIKDSIEYKEYIAFKNALTNNIKLEQEQIYELQKKIVNNTYKLELNNDVLKDEYNTKINDFITNDFVIAYQNAYDQLEELITEITDFLENIIWLSSNTS
ncbi:YlbF family regulator [Mycoplasma sp. P36-A1]|uniref:YlbF family regulator n=1 Tax=Mycoplasma sp. P36-A1 TaxID=3252900 RepID=UPI003C2B908E